MTLATWALFATTVLAEPAGGVVEGKIVFKTGGLLGASEARGEPAVVFVDAPARPVRPPEPAKMAQRNKAFEPGLLVVQAGMDVAFPNEDKVFHNVFSLTKGSEFDLGLYRQGASKTVRFDKPGAIDIFCNIHPQMVATILVTPGPHHTRVADDGTFRLPLPAGKHQLVAFWPGGGSDRRTIDVAPGAVVRADFELTDTQPTERHLNKHGQPYGRYK